MQHVLRFPPTERPIVQADFRQYNHHVLRP